MNNEPVGVVCEFEGTLVGTLFEQLPDGTKLYTHPVKELTDEEIEIEWFKVFKPETGIGKNLTNGVYEFALAILKKAQEK